MHHEKPADDYPPIETRADGANDWSAAVPLLLVSLLALMLLHSCMHG
jgi:hypothetical protein